MSVTRAGSGGVLGSLLGVEESVELVELGAASTADHPPEPGQRLLEWKGRVLCYYDPATGSVEARRFD